MLERWFNDSETILWARLNAAMGAIAGVLTYIDPSLVENVLPDNWGVYYVLINGVATEYLRRHRAEDM